MIILVGGISSGIMLFPQEGNTGPSIYIPEIDFSVPRTSALSDYLLDRNSTWDSPQDDFIRGITSATFTGGIVTIFTGGITYMDGTADFFVNRWDQFGNLVWTRTWGGPGVDSAEEIYYDATSNSVWVVGSSNSWNTSKNMAWSVWDLDGTLKGNNTWGGPGEDVAMDLAYTGGDVLYIVGYSNSWNETKNIVRLQVYWNPVLNYFPYNNESWGDTVSEYQVWDISESFAGRYMTGCVQQGTQLKHFILNWHPTTPWNYSILGTTANSIGTSVVVNSSYVYISVLDAGALTTTLKCWDTSGAFQWEKPVVGQGFEYGMDLKMVGNALLLTGLMDNVINLTMWDSSGTITSSVTRSNMELSWCVSNYAGLDTVYDSWNGTLYVVSERNPGGTSGRCVNLDMLAVDNDGDGAGNLTEVMYGIDDSKADWDEDGLLDGWEIDNNLNPKSSDSEGDGMPDGWENDNGLDFKTNDANLDSDGDLWTNLYEYQHDTDPNVDDRPPMIVSISLVKTPVAGTNVSLRVEIEEGHPDTVLLHHSFNGTSTKVKMTNETASIYTITVLTPDLVAGDELKYVIFANDTAGNNATSPELNFIVAASASSDQSPSGDDTDIPGYPIGVFFGVVGLCLVGLLIKQKNH